MPFTRTDVPPSTTPPITIKFSGLMVLQPGAIMDTCEIGVHKFDRCDHLFQMILLVSKPNPTVMQPPLPPLPPIMVPLVTGPLTAQVWIRLASNPRPDNGTFKVFAKDPFTRTSPPSHVNDYRWGVNLRSRHLDAYTTDGAKPSVILKTGVLYAPDLTRDGLRPQLVCPGTIEELNHIATHFAVTIQPSGPLVIEWNDQGNERALALPRERDPEGTVYTLYLINEPPNFDGLPHDELPLYYRVLASGGMPIPAEQRCELKFATGTRSDEIPCMPITLNP